MGHDVTHVNLRFSFYLPWYKKPFSYLKRFLQKYLLGKDTEICIESSLRKQYENQCAATEPFYQRYIKHTEPITDIRQLKKLQGFNAYVVGSDQVWRKQMTRKY